MRVMPDLYRAFQLPDGQTVGAGGARGAYSARGRPAACPMTNSHAGHVSMQRGSTMPEGNPACQQHQHARSPTGAQSVMPDENQHAGTLACTALGLLPA